MIYIFYTNEKKISENNLHVSNFNRLIFGNTEEYNIKEFYKNKFNVNTNHILYNDKNLLHFANAIDKSLPVLRLSAVRKPLERLYSHYCYGHPCFMEGMDFNEWYLKTASGEIEDYWNVPQWGDRTDNYMWNYMGIKSLDLIQLQYDIIFVKEKFEESLQKLEDVLNFKFKRI